MPIILIIMSCICPIFALPFIVQEYRKHGQVKFCAFLFGLAMSAALYGYVADQGNDIYRHIFNLRYYTGKSLFQIFDAGPLNAVYVWDIWQWIIAAFHNEYLLQSSGAFLGYSLVAYMIFDYAKLQEFEPRQWRPSIILALLTVSPLTLAIGIRSGNAFIICALAIYQYYNHRTNYFLSLFIIFCTIFLHHAALIILAIWLLFPLFRKRPLIGAIAIVAVLFTYTNYESYISFFMGGGSIFESMGSDLQQSIATYTGSKLNSFHNTVTVAIQTMLVTLLFIRGGGLKQVSLLRHRDENGILSGSINEFQIVLLITTYSLIALLSFNGNRYFVIALVLSFLPIGNTVFWGSYYFPKMEINGFGYQGLFILVGVIFLAVGFYGLNVPEKAKYPIAFVQQYGLGIYCIHMAIGKVAELVLKKAGLPTGNLVICLLIWAACIAGCVTIDTLTKKKARFLIS